MVFNLKIHISILIIFGLLLFSCKTKLSINGYEQNSHYNLVEIFIEIEEGEYFFFDTIHFDKIIVLHKGKCIYHENKNDIYETFGVEFPAITEDIVNNDKFNYANERYKSIYNLYGWSYLPYLHTLIEINNTLVDSTNYLILDKSFYQDCYINEKNSCYVLKRKKTKDHFKEKGFIMISENQLFVMNKIEEKNTIKNIFSTEDYKIIFKGKQHEDTAEYTHGPFSNPENSRPFETAYESLTIYRNEQLIDHFNVDYRFNNQPDIAVFSFSDTLVIILVANYLAGVVEKVDIQFIALANNDINKKSNNGQIIYHLEELKKYLIENKI